MCIPFPSNNPNKVLSINYCAGSPSAIKNDTHNRLTAGGKRSCECQRDARPDINEWCGPDTKGKKHNPPRVRCVLTIRRGLQLPASVRPSPVQRNDRGAASLSCSGGKSCREALEKTPKAGPAAVAVFPCAHSFRGIVKSRNKGLYNSRREWYSVRCCRCHPLSGEASEGRDSNTPIWRGQGLLGEPLYF